MKNISVILATCFIGLCTGLYGDNSFASSPDSASQKEKETKESPAPIQNVEAGHYLASRFAQTNYDWGNANKFIHKLIDTGITSHDILQRAMILSMGSGNAREAIKIAKHVKAQNPEKSNTVVDIFLITEAFKQKKHKTAEELFKALPNDGTTKFIGPFIQGWLYASQNSLNIKHLKNNTVQLYHAIIISDFLNDHSDIEKMIDKALKVEEINPHERERIADLYGHVGLQKKALKLYKFILKDSPENEGVKNKIIKLEQHATEPLFKKISSANQGMAKAFHDISNILYNEKNDESARVFAHLALYLNPEMTSTKFLLAGINTTHKQYEKAISIYRSIPKSDDNYIEAQYEIVDIYEETERFDDALALLKNLSEEQQDVDTIIKIGNLYRHQENFDLALKSYDSAVEKLGGTIPENYWHLHYVRGISYEQSNNWDRAEKELKAALAFQPDHPYILNYLGYAWADKGINLEESLKMIQRAVNLRPSDGYITDSLGWVMYRIKNYENAVSVLERAVELLPDDPTINDHLGDAYWKVGRILEAKFQWKRAKNNSDDDEQVKKIENKITSGIQK